jgi:hypothetical protein
MPSSTPTIPPGESGGTPAPDRTNERSNAPDRSTAEHLDRSNERTDLTDRSTATDRSPARSPARSTKPAGSTPDQALRSLANRLVGILHGCLANHLVYDEQVAWPPDVKLVAS